MPRISRTIIPRIRKSLRDRGLVTSIRRSFLLPLHLLREYRTTRNLQPGSQKSEFDHTYAVDTDGECGGWTYLSDLEIGTENWIEGNDYLPIEPERFARVMQAIKIPLEQYTFIDFGSGKGRALLLASEYPFIQIIGLEFSAELHQIAEENIRQYRAANQKCRSIRSCNIDFVNFRLPLEPLLLFFFDPCSERVLGEVLNRIEQSLRAHPRPVFVVYVAPNAARQQLLSSSRFLTQLACDTEGNFFIYRACR